MDLQQIVSVDLYRAEGRTSECIHARGLTLAQADREIACWGYDAPHSSDGYHKVDVTVHFTDGSIFQDRFDMTFENSLTTAITDFLVHAFRMKERSGVRREG